MKTAIATLSIFIFFGMTNTQAFAGVPTGRNLEKPRFCELLLGAFSSPPEVYLAASEQEVMDYPYDNFTLYEVKMVHEKRASLLDRRIVVEDNRANVFIPGQGFGKDVRCAVYEDPYDPTLTGTIAIQGNQVLMTDKQGNSFNLSPLLERGLLLIKESKFLDPHPGNANHFSSF